MGILINRDTLNRSTPIEPSPDQPAPIQPTPTGFSPPSVVKPGDPTVLVNGKPVEPAQEGGKKPASGATKEAAAAKVGEQKLSGQIQEAKVRSQFDETSKDQSVLVNHKSPVPKDECRDKNTTE